MIFVTATDTGVGKTHFSRLILDQAAEYFNRSEIAYLKPVQAGKDIKELYANVFYETDYQCIERSCHDIDTYCTYFLENPTSPDYAAKKDATYIETSAIVQHFKELKSQYKFIVVEGAGGLMVPINDNELISDIALALKIPTVLITKPILGTINHTLLSCEHAKNKGLDLRAIIMAESIKDRDTIQSDFDGLDIDGEQLEASKESIERFSGIKFNSVAGVLAEIREDYYINAKIYDGV